MSDMLPCPFCGHVGLEFCEGSTFRWLEYYCANCGIGSEVRLQTMGEGKVKDWRIKGEHDAIEDWNKRVVVESDDARDARRYRWLRKGLIIRHQATLSG